MSPLSLPLSLSLPIFLSLPSLSCSLSLSLALSHTLSLSFSLILSLSLSLSLTLSHSSPNQLLLVLFHHTGWDVGHHHLHVQLIYHRDLRKREGERERERGGEREGGREILTEIRHLTATSLQPLPKMNPHSIHKLRGPQRASRPFNLSIKFQFLF